MGIDRKEIELNMITDTYQLRPRYGEVDQMGYVYHANYVSYCHQARTELLRKFGINDAKLEANNIMMPVISFNIRYRKPANYDELLTIKTSIKEMPKIRFGFEFKVTNEKDECICTAESEVVFVNKNDRKPIRIPEQISKALIEFA